MKKIVELKNVSKVYKAGEKEFKALDDIDLSINKGEFVVVLGPSGAGKSTLLNLIGGMDTPTSGQIIIDDENISNYNEEKLSEYRAENIGFIFQFYNILPTLTVLENVEIVKDIVKNAGDSKSALEAVGLIEHINKFPNQLSGGEQQRVSIARAIAKNPKLLLCDEPTGALDEINRQKVYRFLKKASQRRLILIVSHDQKISKYTPYHLNFECLKHHYDWNHQLYSRYEIRKTKCGLLFKEMIQMILKDKKKWVMMFVSQIYMVLAMTLIITGLEGFNGYYQKQYNQAINNNLVMIQKKNQEPFKEKEITKLKGKYQYHLDIGKIEGLKNFQSFSINKKTKQNEVYVNHALITKIKQNKLIYKLNHHQYTLKIKGVIQDDYQEPVLYYHSLSNAIALQCIDVSTCIVYVKNHKYMKDYLTHLSVQYQGIAPIYEEYESYFKVIDLFKKVSLVFIFLSFMIAIVLMGYMVLSMFYENQKIFAIMLANGYQNHHLAFFILKK